VLSDDDRDDKTAARDAMTLALQRGIPVYTEGLRLLMEGLRLTGAATELDQLRNKLGMVHWLIPLTTCISVSKRMNRVPSISSSFQSSL
jgi:hypothetical protein